MLDLRSRYLCLYPASELVFPVALMVSLLQAQFSLSSHLDVLLSQSKHQETGVSLNQCGRPSEGWNFLVFEMTFVHVFISTQQKYVNS